jgi:hypothetical protein
MLKLTRDIERNGRVIPKGTPLIGAYNVSDNRLMTQVDVDGERIKLVVAESDTTMRSPSKQ